MNFKITFFWRMEQQTDFVQFLKCTYSTVLEPARPIRLREQRMQRGARRTPVASWHARCTYASGARRHCGRLEFLAVVRTVLALPRPDPTCMQGWPCMQCDIQRQDAIVRTFILCVQY
jgi:hypothetical protein